MHVIILNWKNGSNDPFSVVNATIHYYFHACGKNVEIVEIAENGWEKRIAEIATEGIDFVYTWQGLGSTARMVNLDENIWDYLKVPLICVHADHPAHMPRNHELESPYCFHLYTNASFARYSNRHFRRRRGASTLDFPQLFYEQDLGEPKGDYFVIAKNVTDPEHTENLWREKMAPWQFKAHMEAAEILKQRLSVEPFVEIDDVLDQYIQSRELEWMYPAQSAHLFHQFHSLLDFYARDYKSLKVVSELREVPLRVYGRGWERFAQEASPLHSFHPGRDMKDSQEMFYSRFGLIDISPAKELHDRTRRAMDNRCAFLSSASLEDSFPDIDRYEGLFFDFTGEKLKTRCASIMDDPKSHLDLSRAFSDRYHQRFPFKEFVSKIDGLGKSAYR